VLAERLVYDANILCAREEEEEGPKESPEEVGRTPTEAETVRAEGSFEEGSGGETGNWNIRAQD